MAEDFADQPGRSLGLQPAQLLRPDRRDSYALLVLWWRRQGSRALMILGIIPPLLVGQLTADLPSRLDTPGELLRGLVSPLVFIAAAIVLRIAVGAAAMIIAFPIDDSQLFDPGTTPPRTRLMAAFDRFTLASGRRTLRWSWAVRRTAAIRLGAPGEALEFSGLLLTWATPASMAAVVAVAWFVP